MYPLPPKTKEANVQSPRNGPRFLLIILERCGTHSHSDAADSWVQSTSLLDMWTS